MDGKRFCNTKKDYQMLRETSDKLCLEYGLSVIKNPKKYTKKVNQYILKSFMNEIKRDIDATVLECARYMEFNAVMHNKGYSFGEINSEPVIYHPYCEEPIYIKSLGNQYHREQIKERLTTKVIPFQNMEQNKYYYQCKDYYRQYRQKKLPQLAKSEPLTVAYVKDEDEKEMWSTKAKEFTPQIKSLRFEIKSCKRIRERSIQKDIEKLAMKKIKQRESRDER